MLFRSTEKEETAKSKGPDDDKDARVRISPFCEGVLGKDLPRDKIPCLKRCGSSGEQREQREDEEVGGASEIGELVGLEGKAHEEQTAL